MPKHTFAVHAGRHPRRRCPMVLHVPVEGARPEAVRITTEAGQELPAQASSPHPLSPHPGARNHLRVTFMLPELAAEQSLRLALELGAEGRGSPPGVQVKDDGKANVAVTVGGQPLTVYRYLGNPVRPCFFPLLGPGGKRVTRSWPITDDIAEDPHDHPHHRSLWVSHGDINGVDNWGEGEASGSQLHRELLGASGGPVFGFVDALNDWTDHEQRKMLEERRVLTAYAVGEDERLFDFDVCLTATEGDVRLGDTKEGGIIAFRVAGAIDGNHGGLIENSYGGLGEGECWGKRAQWCDYSGELEGERLGLAIFDHPRSFRHPTFWHVRDYGMYTANPFGWHDFYGDPSADGSHLLPRGASLHFHYRVYLHRGDAREAGVADRYHDYANPPAVEMLD